MMLNGADKINLTTLEIVLIILAVLLFLSHIVSLVIFIYWNVGQPPQPFSIFTLRISVLYGNTLVAVRRARLILGWVTVLYAGG